MKRFLVLFLVILTSLVFAGSAAAVSVVSFDTTLNGTVNASVGSNDIKEDLSLNSFAYGTQFDKFTAGIEYGVGTLKSAVLGSSDCTFKTFKGSYRLFDATATKLDGFLGLMNINIEDTEDLNSTLAGIDVTQFFSRQVFVTANLGMGIAGTDNNKMLNTKYDSIPLTLIRVKCNYLINEKIGIAGGYTNLKYTLKKDLYPTLDSNLTSFSLGAFYLF